MKIAQLQTHVYDDKNKNLDEAAALVEKAASDDADMVTLGEMFCCPYVNELFSKYAEPDEGPTEKFLSNVAKEITYTYLLELCRKRTKPDIYITRHMCSIEQVLALENTEKCTCSTCR